MITKNCGENSVGKHDTIREQKVQVPTKNALANRRVRMRHTTSCFNKCHKKQRRMAIPEPTL